MTRFESELKRLEKGVLRLTNLALFPKRIEVRGGENFVLQGPNIIVGNHIGSQKDVGLLFKIVPRPIFFTANKMIFNKGDFSFLVREHLHRHLKGFGLVLHLLLNPFYALVVDYISSNIARVGSIPVDLDGGRAEAIKKCEDYLKKGRAIIALQGRGRIDPKDATRVFVIFERLRGAEKRPGTGVGLANVRERLQLLYGGKASVTVAENQPSGTVVTTFWGRLMGASPRPCGRSARASSCCPWR
jgi:hypothetical protein